MGVKKEEVMSWPDIVDETYGRVSGFVKDERGFKTWMLSKENLGYIVDYILWGKLYLCWKDFMKEKDKVIVITGPEGIGKSTLEMCIGSILDPSFNVERVTIGALDAIHALRLAKPGQAVAADEGALMLLSRESMSDGNRRIIKILMVIRKKSLFFIICIPDFKLLDTYVRTHRVSLLFDVRSRGHYTAYFGEGLRYISEQLKYRNTISGIRCSQDYFWQGSFRNTLGLVSMTDYAAKKDKHIESFMEEMENEFEHKKKDTEPLVYNITQAAKLLNMDHGGLHRRIKAGTVKASLVGHLYYITKEEINRFLTPTNIDKSKGLKVLA